MRLPERYTVRAPATVYICVSFLSRVGAASEKKNGQQLGKMESAWPSSIIYIRLILTTAPLLWRERLLFWLGWRSTQTRFLLHECKAWRRGRAEESWLGRASYQLTPNCSRPTTNVTWRISTCSPVTNTSYWPLDLLHLRISCLYTARLSVHPSFLVRRRFWQDEMPFKKSSTTKKRERQQPSTWKERPSLLRLCK